MAPALALTSAPPALVPTMALALVPVPLDPSQNHNYYSSSAFIDVTSRVPCYIVRERIQADSNRIPARFQWESRQIPVGFQPDSSSVIYGGSGARVKTTPKKVNFSPLFGS